MRWNWLVLVVGLTACVIEEEPSGDCTTSASASVQVDASVPEDPLAEIALTFTTADGEHVDEACENVLNELWVCGWEVVGDFVITGTAEGFDTSTLTATVVEGACHVETVTVEMVLGTVTCTDQEVPSVSVTVVDLASQPVATATVDYLPLDAEGSEVVDWMACDAIDDGHLCGWEVAGRINVRASAEGYETVSTQVAVEEDSCHVLTEAVELVLGVVNCTDELVPSVTVTVVDAVGQTVEPATMEYLPLDAEGSEVVDWMACDWNFDHFVCGSEVAGRVNVRASAEGYETASTQVTVEEDACHVLTEIVVLTLVADPI